MNFEVTKAINDRGNFVTFLGGFRQYLRQFVANILDARGQKG